MENNFEEHMQTDEFVASMEGLEDLSVGAAADIHKMETKRGLNDGGGATNSGQTDHEILRDPAPVRSKGCAGVSLSSTQKKRKKKQCTACKKIGHNKLTCERRRHRANTTHLPDADSHNNEFSDDSVGGMVL
ncbi:hypothetical protein P8452_56052 [Trifolium repens]|nr:hypothetical protein P8452_56052 [Trifolium repens]